MKNKEFEFLEELTKKEKNEVDTEEERTDALEKRRFITNSENKSDCWYIENQKLRI